MSAAGANRAGEISFRRAESSAACCAGPVRWDLIAHAIRGPGIRRARARTSAAARRARQVTSTYLIGWIGSCKLRWPITSSELIGSSICSRCLGCPITCTSSKTIVSLSEAVGEIAIAIRCIAAMTRVVLPSTRPLGWTLRKLITPIQVVTLVTPVARIVIRVVNLVAPIVTLIVPVLIVATVVVVVVVHLGVTVPPIVITVGRTICRADSIANVRVTIIGVA